MYQYTDEQAMLRGSIRALLSDHCTIEQVRSDMTAPDSYSVTLWKRLADAGVLALGVPERLGGAGGGAAEQLLAAEELGASLACVPHLSSAVLATSILAGLASPTDETAALLADLMAGHRTAAVAVERGDVIAPDAPQAVVDGARCRITGSVDLVIDGGSADALILGVDSPDGPLIALVPDLSRGTTRTSLPTLDLTRRMARLQLAEVAGHVLCTDLTALEQARNLGAAALAAEQVGASARLLATTLEHAQTRLQFGRPIGSFQAVKHRCADMALRVETARATMLRAAHELTDNHLAGAAAASLAKAYCCDTGIRIATGTIQILGGIGFSWEHAAHLYLKRAKASQLLLGGPGFHKARVLRDLAAG